MNPEQSSVWRPHPGPQTEAFRYFEVDEILYGGSKGGGKTDWLLFDFLQKEYADKPNYRGIIFRRTFPRLREIIDRSLVWFRGIAEYKESEKCWVFPSGSKLYFAHCQHEQSKYDYQGQEYQYMGFDQLEEFTETQYDFLRVQCRTTDPTIKVRIRATANPGNIGHLWVKRRFIDNKVPVTVYRDDLGLLSMYIPARVYDNPSIMLNDPTYVKRLESLPEKERRALLEGDWNIFAGQFFGEWTPDVHIVKPYHIPDEFPRFIAGDYGWSAPSSIGWYAVNPDTKGLIRYKELYREKLLYRALAEEMLKYTGDDKIKYAVFDPAIFGDFQHHADDLSAREGESGADVMQKIIGTKFPIMRGDNRRIIGWNTCREYLKIVDGLAKFEVFSNCTAFTTTVPGCIHDDKNPEDLDTDGEDHCADEWRLACMSRPPLDRVIAPRPQAAWNSPYEKVLSKVKGWA